jgi:hypothetical protein
MTKRHSEPCPGTRICCPACHRPLLNTEIVDGEGFFRCEARVCRTHFYAACADYFCTTTAVSLPEHQHMRTLATKADRLAYLATRVAWSDEALPEAA